MASLACACTEAIGDELRLRAVITERLGAALGAECALAIAGEATLAAPSGSTVDIALRHHEVTLGTLRVIRRDPLDREELELAGLVAEHAAVAWSKHATMSLQQGAEVHARLAAIVESSDDAIVGKNLDGIVTSWNRAAEQLFGYTFEEVRGKSITLLIPEERLHEEATLLAHLRAGQVTRLDTMRRRKDGQEIAVAVTSSPVYDTAGRLIGASKIARDITRRHAAELALAGAVASAQSANRELEAFSYSVAHDLRAPLRAISGFSQVLVEDYGPKLDDAGRELIDDIRAGANTMGTLIDALLLLARLTRSELRREPIDLAVIVRDAAELLAASQPGRDVEVVATGPLLVVADPRLARVVVDNLLGNAWKFTGKVPHARIEVGETLRDGVRAFYVRDNGAGFDMAHASNLFAPFQRLHTVREFAGTGIGLATAQRIVHRHGGRIWAESAVDAGATFYFTLGSTEESRT